MRPPGMRLRLSGDVRLRAKKQQNILDVMFSIQHDQAQCFHILTVRLVVQVRRAQPGHIRVPQRCYTDHLVRRVRLGAPSRSPPRTLRLARSWEKTKLRCVSEVQATQTLTERTEVEDYLKTFSTQVCLC